MKKPIIRDASDPRWERLREYVYDIAERMNLKNYWFSFEMEPPPAQKDCAEGYTADAEVQMHPNSLAVRIWFGDSFFKAAPEFQRSIVVHELLHVLEKPTDALVDILLEQTEIPSLTWKVWVAGYNQSRERFIDTIACTFAALMPLPSLNGETPADD